MPQPVHYSTRIHFDFYPQTILQRPELASHIAYISALWNEIEARTAAFLSALSDGDETVIAVFLAIKNDGAKRSTIDVICERKLPPEDNAKFQTILKKIGERYADRNLVVHGAWGISDKYPDKLLWADIRATTIFFVELMSVPPEKRQARLIESQKGLMVYGLADFLEIEKRLREVYEELRDFSRPFMEKAFGPFSRVDPPPTRPQPR